ncbi:hypothetical protein ACFPZP_11690 [Citrobacter bitternis]|uniref:Uncharacterized protein n=1 Tax=Citrobacter bitternis TaxID=1585982 RepID=A0ABW1PZU1_9ENTR
MIPLIAAVLFSLTLTGVDAPVVISVLDAVIVILAFGGARESAGRSPKTAALYLIFCVWGSVQFCISVPGDAELQYGLIAASVFLLWEAKTAFVRPVKSDKYDPVYFFYGILPAKGMMGAFNIARPSAMADFGGRVIIGGGWVWCVNRNHFAKVPLARIDISTVVLVNTREPYNATTAKKLDAKTGSRAVYWLNDCASLKCKKSLEHVLLKRWLHV